MVSLKFGSSTASTFAPGAGGLGLGHRRRRRRILGGNGLHPFPGREAQHLAGIDPVRILHDVGVEAVDLGPQERVTEIRLCERPERIARSHGMRLRRVRSLRERSTGQREQHPEGDMPAASGIRGQSATQQDRGAASDLSQRRSRTEMIVLSRLGGAIGLKSPPTEKQDQRHGLQPAMPPPQHVDNERLASLAPTPAAPRWVRPAQSHAWGLGVLPQNGRSSSALSSASGKSSNDSSLPLAPPAEAPAAALAGAKFSAPWPPRPPSRISSLPRISVV